jgi:uncharacterized membrane protein YraQ (UPF0718 family)
MSQRIGATTGFLLLVLIGSLVAYKTTGAARQLEHARANGSVVLAGGVVSADSASLPLRVAASSLNYLAAIWPALVFGILISAAIHAYTPASALAALFGGGPVRRQVVAGACGVPLMLCSCCAVPLFSAVYERSRRLAPSLALLLAAPALNPAALALTFLLFPGSIAWGRLWMSVAAVFVGTALLPHVVGAAPVSRRGSVRDDHRRAASAAWPFVHSSLHVTVRTVPVILLGIVTAMVVAEAQPVLGISSSLRFWFVAITAAAAIPMALPTFFEIPLTVTLLAAGAPAGAAAVLLFAGPTVNLASLLTVGEVAGWRAAWAVGAMVWLIAVLGGLSIE